MDCKCLPPYPQGHSILRNYWVLGLFFKDPVRCFCWGVSLGNREEIHRNTQANPPSNPQKYAEIRRNTQAKTPIKNPKQKHPQQKPYWAWG